MIRTWAPDGRGGLAEVEECVAGALWIDLAEPDSAELDRVGRCVGIPLPSREDMEEIELSSRLYREHGTDFLTLVLPALGETEQHEVAPVTFALGEKLLVTIRYHDPRPFRTFPARAARSPYGIGSAQDILFGLLDAIIDRLADILELTDRRIEEVARRMFGDPAQIDTAGLRQAVAALGQAGTLVSDVRNSLVTVERAIFFLDRERDGAASSKRAHRSLKVLSSDTTSLSEHATFLTQKLALILDAAFNLTSIKQNTTAETFSLVAVLFLPPTLIASIFGMNFGWMPWLEWDKGFWAALAAMAASSALSYLVFRWRNLL
jgi:magnesium transporter